MPRTRYLTAERWVADVLARGRRAGPIPRYGSPEHLALEPSDPRFVAAVAIAAQAHLSMSTPAAVAERLATELATARAVAVELVEEERSAAVGGMVSRPTMAELWRRRGQPDRAMRADRHARALALCVEYDADEAAS